MTTEAVVTPPAIELRSFTLADAPRVAALVGDPDVSQWTANIPYPYTVEDAREWIEDTAASAKAYPFAVEWEGRLVACVSYRLDEPGSVEIGYWVGKAYWGCGIATEALRRMLALAQFPHEARVFAWVMAGNAGSRRVLEKCGFAYRCPGVIRKAGRRVECERYARVSGPADGQKSEWN